MSTKIIKKLNGKKLSTLVEKYNYYIEDFMDNECYEMTQGQYEKLKNKRVSIEVLHDDPNYDYIIFIDKFSAYCIFA